VRSARKQHDLRVAAQNALRLQHVEECRGHLRFLDDTLVSELRSVRLIHGYGTGQLRRAIAGYLRGWVDLSALEAIEK